MKKGKNRFVVILMSTAGLIFVAYLGLLLCSKGRVTYVDLKTFSYIVFMSILMTVGFGFLMRGVSLIKRKNKMGLSFLMLGSVALVFPFFIIYFINSIGQTLDTKVNMMKMDLYWVLFVLGCLANGFLFYKYLEKYGREKNKK